MNNQRNYYVSVIRRTISYIASLSRHLRLDRFPHTFLAILCAILAVSAAGRTMEALELGGDEHFEVTKALLWRSGVRSYDVVWNDQPPLFTAILGSALRVFGADIKVARWIAITFFANLLLACYVLISRSRGRTAGAIAALMLSSSPIVITLGYSAMLEVPAIGLALWALYPIVRSDRSKSVWWLFVSAALLAAGLQTKLTACMALPALALEVFLRQKSVRRVLVWALSVAAIFVALGTLLGNMRYDVVNASHFSKAVAAQEWNTNLPPFVIMMFNEHRDAICAATVSLLILLICIDLGSIRFPLSWLATAIAVHLVHRPWWEIYYLHFAVPIAWVSGVGIATLINTLKRNAEIYSTERLVLAIVLQSVALAFISADVCWNSAQRVITFVSWARHRPTCDGDRIVSAMRRYSNQTKWVFAQDTIYAFHAGLPILPELAILPDKRFWSGQIDATRIASILVNKKPEQILFRDGEIDSYSIGDLIKMEYTPVVVVKELSLYVRNDISGVKRGSANME